MGIAEQNMFGMAAGLAKAGLIPFASTMAIFACMRAGEQIRTDIAYQNLPVKIIATHAGISFGHAGTTHHCTEDFRHHARYPQHDGHLPGGRHRDLQGGAGLRGHARPGLHPHRPRLRAPCYESDDYTYEIGKAITMREGHGSDHHLLRPSPCCRR